MIGDKMYVFVPQIGTFYDIIGIVDYAYRNFKIEPRNGNDISISSSVGNNIIEKPIALLSNYPNPFNPTTEIYFETTRLRNSSAS